MFAVNCAPKYQKVEKNVVMFLKLYINTKFYDQVKENVCFLVCMLDYNIKYKEHLNFYVTL